MLLHLALSSLGLGLVSATCSVSSSVPKADADDTATFQDSCMRALEDQVRVEFEASLQYILMAAHFDQDTVNLPNLANMFWEHAGGRSKSAITARQPATARRSLP